MCRERAIPSDYPYFRTVRIATARRETRCPCETESHMCRHPSSESAPVDPCARRHWLSQTCRSTRLALTIRILATTFGWAAERAGASRRGCGHGLS